MFGPEARCLYSFLSPVLSWLVPFYIPVLPLFLSMGSEVFVALSPEVNSFTIYDDGVLFVFLLGLLEYHFHLDHKKNSSDVSLFRIFRLGLGDLGLRYLGFGRLAVAHFKIRIGFVRRVILRWLVVAIVFIAFFAFVDIVIFIHGFPYKAS